MLLDAAVGRRGGLLLDAECRRGGTLRRVDVLWSGGVRGGGAERRAVAVAVAGAVVELLAGGQQQRRPAQQQLAVVQLLAARVGVADKQQLLLLAVAVAVVNSSAVTKFVGHIVDNTLGEHECVAFSQWQRLAECHADGECGGDCHGERERVEEPV